MIRLGSHIPIIEQLYYLSIPGSPPIPWDLKIEAGLIDRQQMQNVTDCIFNIFLYLSILQIILSVSRQNPSGGHLSVHQSQPLIHY